MNAEPPIARFPHEASTAAARLCQTFCICRNDTRDAMRLWTIQTEAAYRRLITDGQLIADAASCDPDFARPYEWMLGEMKRRLRSERPTPDATLWAWSRWDPPSRNRPDLRSRGHLLPGASGYRIELDVNADDFLLSDFNLWHYVLNYWYVPTCERDNDLFDSKHNAHRYDWDHPPSPDVHDLIAKSWDRIFDLDWWNEYVTGPPSERPVQATLWRIERSMVRCAQSFVGR